MTHTHPRQLGKGGNAERCVYDGSISYELFPKPATPGVSPRLRHALEKFGTDKIAPEGMLSQNPCSMARKDEPRWDLVFLSLLSFFSLLFNASGLLECVCRPRRIQYDDMGLHCILLLTALTLR